MAVFGHSKLNKNDTHVWYGYPGEFPFLFPIMKNIAAKTISFDIVPVVPMDAPRPIIVPVLDK